MTLSSRIITKNIIFEKFSNCIFLVKVVQVSKKLISQISLKNKVKPIIFGSFTSLRPSDDRILQNITEDKRINNITKNYRIYVLNYLGKHRGRCRAKLNTSDKNKKSLLMSYNIVQVLQKHLLRINDAVRYFQNLICLKIVLPMIQLSRYNYLLCSEKALVLKFLYFELCLYSCLRNNLKLVS